MSLFLSKEQIEDLAVHCGSEVKLWRDDDALICCPVHGESNPSMGVSFEKQVCHCFSCGFAGDFASLLCNSLPDDFGLKSVTDPKEQYRINKSAYIKACEFLAERYELEYKFLRKNGKKRLILRKYEEVKYLPEDEDLPVIPRYKIAAYMSGKQTYAYFIERGFTKQDMSKFMIGRDDVNETVTIPVFNEDNELLGVIGRYISPKRKHHERYKIYDRFERSKTLYPLNHFKIINDTIIIVEGQFDAINMHKRGHANTLSTMTNEMSETQAEWVTSHCSTVILLNDNDNRGKEALEKNIKLLKGKVTVKIVDYPDYGKDPCDWSDKDLNKMLKNAHSPNARKLRRYED